MPAMTIRDVPDETRNELAARAARNGQSMQEYLRNTLIGLAAKPDMALLVEQIRERVDGSSTRLSVEQILEYRDADRR
jgi:antitoxin FitA